MILNKLIRKYGEGEQNCCVCNSPLPAHETWPGARHPFCGSAECSASLKARPPFTRPGLASKVGLYVGPNERKCGDYDCKDFLPEGRYDARNAFLTCSAKCWLRRHGAGETTHRCDCGCGEEFIGRRRHGVIHGRRFKDNKHKGAFEKRQHAESVCGELLPIALEFLNTFAVNHYGDYYTISKLASWFEFLKASGITSLDDVTSRTVTAYLKWGAENDRKGVSATIPYISTFFQWAMATEQYSRGNPVISLLHKQPVPKRLPRPLESEELAFLWKVLEERGSARLRLAVALAEEAGPRISEICRLRLSHIDLKQQRILIDLPNKGNIQRYAFFSEKTKKYFSEWMLERNPECGHDYLLYGKRFHPYQVKSLSRDLCQVLCKTYKGKECNTDGFDKWSTHRLRHTMASLLVNAGADAATVMAAGGWRRFESMCLYARVNPEVARLGYENAMRAAREQKCFEPRMKTITAAELLERRRQSTQAPAA